MSNKKKQGVKRTGRQENFMTRLQRNMDDEFAVAYECGASAMQDYMLIALKRCGFFGKKRVNMLHEMVREVREEYADRTIADAKDDKEIWYTKKKLDDELKRVVGEENFVPWEQRRSGVPMSGIICMTITEQRRKIAMAAVKEIADAYKG